MPLFIRNAEVDALAEEVRRVTKVKTKTEAVRGDPSRHPGPSFQPSRSAAPI